MSNGVGSVVGAAGSSGSLTELGAGLGFLGGPVGSVIGAGVGSLLEAGVNLFGIWKQSKENEKWNRVRQQQWEKEFSQRQTEFEAQQANWADQLGLQRDQFGLAQRQFSEGKRQFGLQLGLQTASTAANIENMRASRKFAEKQAGYNRMQDWINRMQGMLSLSPALQTNTLRRWGG